MNIEKNKGTSCTLSIIAASILLMGGIILAAYFLSLLPGLTGVTAGRFILFELAALIPITAGGMWLTKLNRKRREKIKGMLGGIIFGILLIMIGILLMAFNSGAMAGYWKHVIISWPMLLLLIGTVHLSLNSHLTSGMAFISLGTLFIIPRIAGALPGSMAVSQNFAAQYWPVILVVFGLTVLIDALTIRKTHHCCGGKTPRKHFNPDAAVEDINTDEGYVDYNLAFTGSEQLFLEPVFRGGRIKVVFAGMDLDLRRSSLPEGVSYLNVSAVFGGVDINVPEGWHIEIEPRSIFGGVQDERYPRQTPEQNGRKLIITANCVFGGITIK